MLAGIDSDDLSEWKAYMKLEPFGEERADLRAGIIASTIANVNRNPDKTPQPFQPSDFMPVFDRRENEPQSESDGEKRARELYEQMRNEVMERLLKAERGK